VVGGRDKKGKRKSWEKILGETGRWHADRARQPDQQARWECKRTSHLSRPGCK